MVIERKKESRMVEKIWEQNYMDKTITLNSKSYTVVTIILNRDNTLSFGAVSPSGNYQLIPFDQSGFSICIAPPVMEEKVTYNSKKIKKAYKNRQAMVID
jgi:hypothetical protein